jgi:hypothetical protein
MEYMTTYQRDEVMDAAKALANENGAPVCVMYSGLLDVWWLDETPNPLDIGDHALHTVVAPDYIEIEEATL